MIFGRFCPAVNAQHNADTLLTDTEICIANSEIRIIDTLPQRSYGEPLLSESRLNDTLSERSFSELSNCLADSDVGDDDCTTCPSDGTSVDYSYLSSLFPLIVIPEPADASERCNYHELIKESLQMAIEEPVWEGFRVEEGRFGLILLARRDMSEFVFSKSGTLSLNASILQCLDEHQRHLSRLAEAKRHLTDCPHKFSL